MSTKISLLAARINAKLTQIEAGKEIGVSAITLGKYENGQQLPRIDTAYKMSKLYGVPIDMLEFNCGD